MEINNNKMIPVEAQDIYFSQAFDPKNSAPVFKAQRGKDWIPYLDVDGETQYPDLLISLFNNSALHGAIVRSKIEQVAGQGFVWEDSSVNAEMEFFMENINDEETADDLLGKMASDLETFGGIALLVTWTSDWTKIGSIKHLDFSKVRAGLVNTDGYIPGYWYSWDWNKQRSDKVFLPIFNVDTAKNNKAAYEEAVKKGNSEELQNIFLQPTSQIYYWKPYRSGSFYYPLPSYVGAINAIKADIAADQYGLSSFENGLNADVMVTFIGINTPEQQNIEAKKFLKMYTGATKARKPIIAFAKDAESAMKVEALSNSKEDKVYTSVNENVMQKILSGHRVTEPLLVGIKTAGQLGAAEEMKQTIDFWNRTVITPDQQVIERIMNKFLDINGLPYVEIKPFFEFEEPEEEVVEETPTDETEQSLRKMGKTVVNGEIKKRHTYETKKQIGKSVKETKSKK